jgi:hypothetical protein
VKLVLQEIDEDFEKSRTPPNLRESSDYNKEPFAPRCFNCEYLREENLEFYCSKFMTKTKVYQVCDAWESNRKRQEFPIVFVSRSSDETSEKSQNEQKIVEREYGPFIFISERDKSDYDYTSKAST